jgi:hypothetical protein
MVLGRLKCIHLSPLCHSLMPLRLRLLLEIWKGKVTRCWLDSAEMIQAGGKTSHSEIHKLNKLIWNQEELPRKWKVNCHTYSKKSDKTDCSNYEGISLLSTSHKILSVLFSRLTPYTLKIIRDHWCGFWCNKSVTDHIFCIQQMLEKKWEYKDTVHQLFINFKTAHDSVWREASQNILTEFRIPRKLVGPVQMCLNETYSTVCTVSYSGWPQTRRHFITTAFQLCFGIYHYEGPR